MATSQSKCGHYELTCPCGQAVTGQRQARHQVVSCPACARPVFVLPLSPREGTAGSYRMRRRWSELRAWRGPLVAGGLTLGLLLALFVLVLPMLGRGGSDPGEPSVAEGTLGAMASARRALEAGRFHAALRELNAAIAQRDRRSGPGLSPAQHRQLNQLQRQADLLTRLSPLSLQEVLARVAAVRDPEERAEQFKDHRGKTVIFDDAVTRDAEGRPALVSYEVTVGDRPARLALEDLALLHDLPLEQSPRLIFGARLAGCERDEGGTWVVRFERDSAVLLTDLAAAVVCTDPLEPELREVLDRQQGWLDGLAAQKPAGP